MKKKKLSTYFHVRSVYFGMLQKGKERKEISFHTQFIHSTLEI
jgi:hypothetical protein